SGTMYSVNTMNAALVIGIKGTNGGVWDIFARIWPCSAKPSTHATTSGIRPGKNECTMIPVSRTNPGRIQSQTPGTLSGKWEGGPKPTWGKSTRVRATQKLEGLKIC